MFRKVIYNTSSQIVAKIISALVTFLVTILISNSLGETGYGDFTKIFVFIGYFYTLADFGLNAVYIKITKSPKDQLHYLKTLLGQRLVLAGTLTLLAIVTSMFLPFNSSTLIGFSSLVKLGIVLASATIITQSLLTTANAYFQKNLHYDLSALAVICGSLVILTSTIIASLTTRSLLAYTAAYVAGGLTFAISAFFLIYKREKQLIYPLFSKVANKLFTKEAWPIGTALILNLVYFRIDVIILSTTRSTSEVGVYGLAYQFFEASLAVPIFFANSLYPLLATSYQQSRQVFKSQVKSWILILLALSLALSFALFLGAYLIPIIYQGRFQGSVAALQILSLGMPLFFLSALFWHLLILYGKQKYLILIYGCGAFFNLLANLIFIPRNGYLAAATVTVVSEGIVLLLLIIFLRKLTDD